MTGPQLRTSGGMRQQGVYAEGTAMYPLVTVITAVRNGADHLAQCIESVLEQDYANVEHIILDGNSTDGTLAEILRYEDRIAYWRTEPDEGVFDAWNKGISLANGEWIAFLGSDDVYLPGALTTYIGLARQHPEAEFLSSKARLNHPTGYAPTFGGPWAWPQFTKAMSTIHVGTLHRRELLRRLGPFNPKFRIAGDYEFLLRANDELHTAFTPQTTVIMRAGGLSDSTAGLHEAKRAKLHNQVCSPLRAEVDLRRLIVRFYLRRAWLFLRASTGAFRKKKREIGRSIA